MITAEDIANLVSIDGEINEDKCENIALVIEWARNMAIILDVREMIELINKLEADSDSHK